MAEIHPGYTVNQYFGSKGIGSIIFMHIHIYQDFYLKFQSGFFKYQPLKKYKKIHSIFFFQRRHEIATVNRLIIMS